MNIEFDNKRRELYQASNEYHKAHPSERAELEKRIENVLEQFSMMELAKLIVCNPMRAAVFVARHSDTLTLEEAKAARPYVSDREAAAFFAKVAR